MLCKNSTFGLKSAFTDKPKACFVIDLQFSWFYLKKRSKLIFNDLIL